MRATKKTLLGLTGALAACMGKEGRAIAETELDARKAADLILNVMKLVS